MRSLPALLCCLLLLSCHTKRPKKHDPAAGKEEWKGSFSATTCNKIEVQLTLERRPGVDTGAFKMVQTCRENDYTFTEEGRWQLIPGKDTLYSLRGKEAGQLRYYKKKKGRLLELDADKNEVTSWYLEPAD